MSLEKTKTSDVMSSGLIAATRPAEKMTALGYFTIQCYDKDGNLKWEDTNHNLVVNQGLQYMAGVALTSTTQVTNGNWYIGLINSGASIAAGDTIGTHAGWTEFSSYTPATRKNPTFTAATLNNPSVVTNPTAASFSINGSGTVGGAFLCTASTGTTGTLFSAANFISSRSVLSGDTLNVTYTLNLAG